MVPKTTRAVWVMSTHPTVKPCHFNLFVEDFFGFQDVKNRTKRIIRKKPRFRILSISNTPPKINIEPEHDGLEDDFPFQRSILRFHFNLPGCTDCWKGILISWFTGWWLNQPFEKYARQIGFIFPNFRGEHKNMFENHHPVYEIIPTKLGSTISSPLNKKPKQPSGPFFHYLEVQDT